MNSFTATEERIMNAIQELIEECDTTPPQTTISEVAELANVEIGAVIRAIRTGEVSKRVEYDRNSRRNAGTVIRLADPNMDSKFAPTIQT